MVYIKEMERQIPTFKEAFQLLELPKYLNGREFDNKWGFATSKKEKAVLIETCRRLQDLYDEIYAARFALMTSCQGRYPEYFSINADESSHLRIQSQFVNTAILWYNATFDILLQVIWVYYKLYEVNPPKKKITTGDLEDILGKCKKDKVVNTVPDDDIKSELNSFITKYHSKKSNNKDVHEWAKLYNHCLIIGSKR